jgi:putative addiction module component (TIGR02574 family)
VFDVKIRRMPSPPFSELLKLPAGERAELAMALWDSLSADEREPELKLSPGEAAELDRRWREHLEAPDSAVPWDEVRRELLDRE